MGSNKQRTILYPQLTPLWIAVFIDVLGFNIIIPFLPYFLLLYHTTPFVIGLLLAMNAIFTIFCGPIWGKSSDKYGRKPMFVICHCGTLVGFFILAFSNSIEMLFLSRIVDGIFGGIYPISKSVISDAVPPKDRGLQMTNIGVIQILAQLVGPGIGGLLSGFGIIGPGLMAVSTTLTSLIAAILFLKETLPKSIRIQKDVMEKIKFKLTKNKDAQYLLTLWAFHTTSFTIYITVLATFLGLVLGLDPIGIGILMTVSGLFRAAVRFTVFKPTIKKLGEDNTIKLGLGIMAASLFFVGFVRDLVGFIIILIFISFAASCIRGPLISKITQTVKPKEYGEINGFISSLDAFANIIGPLIWGLMLGILEPHWLGVCMSAIALVALAMIFKEITLIPTREGHLTIEDG